MYQSDHVTADESTWWHMYALPWLYVDDLEEEADLDLKPEAVNFEWVPI